MHVLVSKNCGLIVIAVIVLLYSAPARSYKSGVSFSCILQDHILHTCHKYVPSLIIHQIYKKRAKATLCVLEAGYKICRSRLDTYCCEDAITGL